MMNGKSICAYLLVIAESDNLLKGKNLLKRVPKHRSYHVGTLIGDWHVGLSLNQTYLKISMCGFH